MKRRIAKTQYLKDEHNLKLEANVHPLDWTNPVPSERYNLVVIGAGTAGLVTAAGAAGWGAKGALIERELMGGDCLNVGCVPSKGIISAARVAAALASPCFLSFDWVAAAVASPWILSLDWVAAAFASPWILSLDWVAAAIASPWILSLDC